MMLTFVAQYEMTGKIVNGILVVMFTTGRTMPPKNLKSFGKTLQMNKRKLLFILQIMRPKENSGTNRKVNMGDKI